MPLVSPLTDAESLALAQRSVGELPCRFPGCAKAAVHVLGVVRDINFAIAYCDEHFPNNTLDQTVGEER